MPEKMPAPPSKIPGPSPVAALSSPESKTSPPSTGLASAKEDIDFLRSYLSDKPSGETSKPVVATTEWQQIKDYALGLQAPGTRKREEAVGPATQKAGADVKPAEKERAGDTEPRADGRKDGKPGKEAVPSLDDILKELDG